MGEQCQYQADIYIHAPLALTKNVSRHCNHPGGHHKLLRSGELGCNLRFVGRVEDEIRIAAEDALGAMEGLEVRRVFSGWGFYRLALLFAAAWEGGFPSVLASPSLDI
jgi:hypothetical protein